MTKVWYLARALIALAIGVLLVRASPTLAQSPSELTYDTVETSGIDGRTFSGVFSNAKTVDAVHRAVLIRFLGAPEAIKARLDAGLRIKSAAIEFTYAGYELHPAGYVVRDGLGQKKWQQDPPRWHLVAWPLRKPWIADAKVGPTFTHAINGVMPWAEFGAESQTEDRFPIKFGPAELSEIAPTARLDISAFFTTSRRRSRRTLAPSRAKRLPHSKT